MTKLFIWTWGKKKLYVNGEVWLKELLLNFELDTELDILIIEGLAQKGGFIFHQPKFSLIFQLLNIDFFVPHQDVEPHFVLVDDFKDLAVFGLAIHPIPESQRTSLLEGPSGGGLQLDAFLITVDVDMGVEIGINWRLVVK